MRERTLVGEYLNSIGESEIELLSPSKLLEEFEYWLWDNNLIDCEVWCEVIGNMQEELK